MKIRTTVEALIKAFEIAGIVSPKIRASTESAFLVARHGDKVFVHSYDGQRYVRTELAVESIEDEGGFAFPVDKVKSLNFVEGWIELESGHDEKRHWLKYVTEGGAKVDFSTYDHNNYNTLVKKFDETTSESTYSSAILLTAIRAVTGYSPKEADKTDEHYNTLQLFDASRPEWIKGDGVMQASDGTRVAFFSCEALKGKGLKVHTNHLGQLQSFLTKAGQTVKAKFGPDYNFLVNLNDDGSEGAVIGWASTAKEYSHYKYYGTSEDHVVLMVPKDLIIKSLKHMQAVLSEDNAKIRLSCKGGSLHFEAVEGSDTLTSVPVGVSFLTRDDKTPSLEEFGYNVGVDHFLDLFTNTRGHEVELRVAIVPKTASRKEAAFFRTIENFRLDAAGEIVISPEDSYECQVTRFMPSKTG